MLDQHLWYCTSNWSLKKRSLSCAHDGRTVSLPSFEGLASTTRKERIIGMVQENPWSTPVILHIRLEPQEAEPQEAKSGVCSRMKDYILTIFWRFSIYYPKIEKGDLEERIIGMVQENPCSTPVILHIRLEHQEVKLQEAKSGVCSRMKDYILTIFWK